MKQEMFVLVWTCHKLLFWYISISSFCWFKAVSKCCNHKSSELYIYYCTVYFDLEKVENELVMTDEDSCVTEGSSSEYESESDLMNEPTIQIVTLNLM